MRKRLSSHSAGRGPRGGVPLPAPPARARAAAGGRGGGGGGGAPPPPPPPGGASRDNWYHAGTPGYEPGAGLGVLDVANLAAAIAGERASCR
jgi:hypothetical protein